MRNDRIEKNAISTENYIPIPAIAMGIENASGVDYRALNDLRRPIGGVLLNTYTNACWNPECECARCRLYRWKVKRNM